MIMNDKEKQIEEIVRFIDTHIITKKIAELIPSKIVSYDGRSKGQHLYIEQKMEIAKEMMKQGVVVWTMDEHAKLVSQVRQEFEHEYKDKVVLTKEEYEQLQQSYIVKAYDKLRAENKELLKIKENALELLKQGEQQILTIRKETAREILKEILRTPIKLSYGLDERTVNIMTATLKVNELEKQYGVELV